MKAKQEKNSAQLLEIDEEITQIEEEENPEADQEMEKNLEQYANDIAEYEKT